MATIQPLPGRALLLGRDPGRTRRFVRLAVGLCVLTALVAVGGRVVLAELDLLYAHLLIESTAGIVFLGTVGLVVANGYLNDGLLTSLLVTFAPLVGLFAYLTVETAVLGGTSLAGVTPGTVVSLVAATGAIGLGSHLLGTLLSLQRPPDEPVSLGDRP